MLIQGIMLVLLCVDVLIAWFVLCVNVLCVYVLIVWLVLAGAARVWLAVQIECTLVLTVLTVLCL